MNDPLQILCHRTDNEKLSETLARFRDDLEPTLEHALDASRSAHNKAARVHKAKGRLGVLASALSLSALAPQARQMTHRLPERVPSPMIAECIRQCVLACSKAERKRHKKALLQFLNLDGYSPANARTLADRMISEQRRQ